MDKQGMQNQCESQLVSSICQITCLHCLFKYNITSHSHLLIAVALDRAGYIAIVHDAVSAYTDTIPWLVEEKNTLNCKPRFVVICFRLVSSPYSLSSFLLLSFCQGFVYFGMAMVTILAAARQTHARTITAKQLRQTMGGK